MRRSGASQEWRWQSTKPGTMMVSWASITWASAALSVGAMAAIFLPSISTSPCNRSPTLASMLMMVPPLSRIRSLGSTAACRSKRRRFSAASAAERPPPAATPAAKVAPTCNAPRRVMGVSSFMGNPPLVILCESSVRGLETWKNPSADFDRLRSLVGWAKARRAERVCWHRPSCAFAHAVPPRSDRVGKVARSQCEISLAAAGDLAHPTMFAILMRKEHTMDLQLKNKTALVTGGSAGIGKGIARMLAREGVDVAICSRRPDAIAAAAAEIAKETGRKIVGIPADLTKDEDARNFVAKGHEALGRVDIMVNNAGSSPGGVLEHLSEADWAQSLQLKFMGYVRCLRYVLPIMVKQGGGRVVNLIGNDGVKPSYWEIAPGAANAAGQNLTMSLAGQYGKNNISFCAVNPGPVRTERWAGLVAAMSRDMKLPYEEADKLAPSSIPMGRIAEVEEVANLVTMLASPLMHMVNGTQIEIDGGQEKSLMDRLRDRK